VPKKTTLIAATAAAMFAAGSIASVAQAQDSVKCSGNNGRRPSSHWAPWSISGARSRFTYA